MKATAVDHYTSRRGNCAQSVAQAWTDKKEPSATHAEGFSSAGGGRAPDGLCGALYAAGALAPHAKEAIEERFKHAADGHTACRDIRRNKAMPCADCVATAAGLLEELTEE